MRHHPSASSIADLDIVAYETPCRSLVVVHAPASFARDVVSADIALRSGAAQAPSIHVFSHLAPIVVLCWCFGVVICVDILFGCVFLFVLLFLVKLLL